jgi:hypothetical protein
VRTTVAAELELRELPVDLCAVTLSVLTSTSAVMPGHRNVCAPATMPAIASHRRGADRRLEIGGTQ